MVVHAHPDDESSQTGGTLAYYAAAGWRTVLVTCTDGSQGDGGDGVKPGQPGHRPQQVTAQRSRELATAANILGVCDLVTLGYPDSGIPGDHDPPSPPEAFSRRPLAPMADRLADLLRAYHPDVLITYPPNGLSGHPDHIRTHDLVRAALDITCAADETTAAVVPRLYYIALSRSRLASLASQARAELGPEAWFPPESMAIDDALITTAVDITNYWDIKLAALRTHASQSDAAALLSLFTAASRRDAVRRFEEYVRADPHADPPHSRETGFQAISR